MPHSYWVQGPLVQNWPKAISMPKWMSLGGMSINHQLKAAPFLIKIVTLAWAAMWTSSLSGSQA